MFYKHINSCGLFNAKSSLYIDIRYMYLPNPSAQAECNIVSIFWAEFNRFELRVFLLLDWLPYQG